MLNSQGQFDYNSDGKKYSGYRKADLRISKYIWDELGNAKTVLNIGAGAGSYEPTDRYIIAIEPSETMRKQRSPYLPPAINATAESIPLDDQSVDAAMAILTVHHWPDQFKGLNEIRRVTRGPIVIMTFDSASATEFWMFDYCPEMKLVEEKRYGPIQNLIQILEEPYQITEVPVPVDCTDKFQVALYARPEEFLNPEVRKSQSAWKFLPAGAEDKFLESLSAELGNGEWDRKYGHLRKQSQIRCQLRVLTLRP